MATFKPLHDYVLIKPEQEEQVTKGGLLMPTKDETKRDHGVVVAVGGDVTAVKAGDRVMLRKWQKEDVDIDGVTHILIKVENIFGIYE